MHRGIRWIILLSLCAMMVSWGEWTFARKGQPYGFSGFGLVSQTDKDIQLLTIHDNKTKYTPRIGLVTISGKNQIAFESLAWPDTTDWINDGESLTGVPGEPKTYIALASAGNAYRLAYDPAAKKLTLLGKFSIPNVPKGSNFEGFSLQKLEDGTMIVVWGHRGQDSIPGVIYCGLFNVSTFEITAVTSHEIKVPYPASHVRHISDLKVDESGVVYIASSADNGDDGPFQSAVYIAGAIHLESKVPVFVANRSLTRILNDDQHKIEAMELVPGANGGVIYGTDDEHKGSSVYW